MCMLAICNWLYPRRDGVNSTISGVFLASLATICGVMCPQVDQRTLFPYVTSVVIKVLRTLFPYIKPYAWRFVLAIIFLIVTNFGQIAIPQMLRIAIDRISVGGFSLRSIAGPLMGMAGFALAVAIGRLGWRTSIFGASRRIENGLRLSLYRHLLTLHRASAKRAFLDTS